MPWHLEAAIIGTFIMYAGLLIKKYNLLDLPINLLGIIAIIIIGSYAILKNDAVSMPHNNVSNPILFYVGSLLLSYSIFWISAKLIVKNSFLSYFGNNTLLVMGFNYAINSYSKIVW